MAKYLDQAGLAVLWREINNQFVDNNEAALLVQTEVAKIVDEAPEAFDTLKEIAQWIQDHGQAGIDALTAEVASKVAKEVEGTNGTAQIFNEADGGGAKFVHNDGTESFVGVNDGGENGLVAQIYADKLNEEGKWEGAKLDVTTEGIYYTVGDDSFADRKNPDNLLATKGDIQSATLTAGNGIVITSDNKITYNPDVLSTVDYVDMSISDTLAYIDQQDASEHAGRVAGDNLLQAKIDTKVDKDITSADGQARIFNEVDGGGAKFENVDGTASFAGVNNNTNGGIGAQLYDINVAENKGSKLDVTINGIYYTNGDDSAKPASERDVWANELVVKGDLEEIIAGEVEALTEQDIKDICVPVNAIK